MNISKKNESEIPKTPIKFLLSISKPHRTWAFLSFGSMVAAQVIGIGSYYVIASFIDAFNVAQDKSLQLEAMKYWGLIYLGIFISERLLWRLSGFSGIRWLVDASATGYQKLYTYVVQHSQSYFSNRFAGSISNKASNAVDGGTRLLERAVWGWMPEFVSLFATLVVFWTVHWLLAVATLVIVAIIFVINAKFSKYRRPHVIAYAAASSKLRGNGVDLLTNVSAVRQYARSQYELDRLTDAINDRATKDKKQWFLGEWLMVLNTCIGIVFIGGVLYALYVLFQSDSISVGTVILVVTLLGRIGFMFTFLGNMLNGFVRMYGECEEGLAEILLPHEIVDVSGEALKIETATIEWQNVSFDYEGVTVFKDFNLTIPSGERIGLVGHSGAGKTTFVSLLLRQHELSGGVIKIANQDIASVTQDSLREAVAVVPQEPLLFHRSIRENIAYGKVGVSDTEIEAAAKKAQAHDFIMSLPSGYDTMVGERGVKLSGGQKQRVAIARAILKDAPILVLDEATSALDSESEVAIQKALEELMEGKTVIAVAHRLSTLRKMDRIIVLENGEIIENGTHEELSNGDGVYQKLWEHQAGGFLQD